MTSHDGPLRLADWFCADDQTEILTASGWRRHHEVNAGDIAASLDLTTGIATWVPIQRMNRFQVDDAKMLHVSGKGISALVTEGHRWPVMQRTGTHTRRVEWQIRTTDKLTVDSSVARSAPFDAPAFASVSDALVEVVGWAWTEGSYRTDGGIHISQSPVANPEKCDRITAAITAVYGPATARADRTAGEPAWSTGTYDGTQYWRLNRAAAAAVRAAGPDCVLDAAWVCRLTAEQRDLLVEVSILADGHTRVRGGRRDTGLSQNRKDRADAFQVAAILAGRTTSVHEWSMTYKGEPYPMWRVSILEKVTAKPLRQATAEWTTYTGTVWCPTVEHGTWLCRRDGLVHWTGNCGAGGSTQGWSAVPGVSPTHAANHWARAIESHAANYPDVDHWKGDIRDLDVSRLPYAELFWASPECTNWSRAKGKTQDYAARDVALPGFEDPAPSEEEERSRALMEEVPMYLRAMALRGRPVLAGVVENVVDIRDWIDWSRWRREIEAIGYKTRLIALNSMHAQSRVVARAPQSRDRLYLAYWHTSLGRDPDWEKWLRPTAWCSTCSEWVKAVQSWKDPTRDMGRYRQQYVYRCPRAACRNQIVEPEFKPAYTAIDWTLPGKRIGDRDKPLAAKTMARIEAGISRYARPISLEAAGHTFERRPGVRTWPLDGPLTTQTTTATKAVAVPPLLVPVEGRDGKTAGTVHRPLRTQSTRSETAVVAVPMLVPAGGTWNDSASPVSEPMRARTTRESEAVVVPPFIAELRGGGSDARPVTDPLATVTASGNHHALVVPAMLMRNNGSFGAGGEHCTPVTEEMRTLTTTGHQSLVTWADWAALYAYDNGLRSLLEALPTQTTVEGDALLSGAGLPSVDDCMFRMLEPHEILAGMAFAADYIVLGNRRERVRQAGNAVTPPVAEVIGSALVECITGEALEVAA